MTPPADAVARLAALPSGTVKGTAYGKPYVASTSRFNHGRSVKLVAEELGGPDYISLNLYLLDAGPQLFPCEMPVEKVIAFLRAFIPDVASQQVFECFLCFFEFPFCAAWHCLQGRSTPLPSDWATPNWGV